nr:hypothetical protein [Morchella crassipes]
MVKLGNDQPTSVPRSPPLAPPRPSFSFFERKINRWGATTQRHFIYFPPPRPLRFPPHHYPKGPWPSVKGRKSPPLSPQIFILKFFLPDLYGADPAPPGGKKSRNEKRGRPPPLFKLLRM